MKNINQFPMEFSVFASEKKSLYIAWASFRNSKKSDAYVMGTRSCCFMPPTLKKLEGHIAFGLSVCVSVCVSVCLSVCLSVNF